ncbi:MAG: porin family protein [Bacteroidia bacterium]
MKYLYSLLLLLSISFPALLAQESAVFIGVNGGANSSSFKHTDDLASLYSTRSSVIGINAGVTAGIQINRYSLTTGLQYLQKGGVYSTDNFSDNQGTAYYSAKEKLHYISVPVVVGYQYPLGERVGLSLAMGPSFNFGLAGEIEESTEYFGSNEEEKGFHTVYFGDGVNDDYRKMQVGFQISPGIYVELNSKSRLTMNVVWDSGTQDTFNERYKEANSFFDDYRGNQFSRSTMLNIGYEYRFTLQDKY